MLSSHDDHGQLAARASLADRMMRTRVTLADEIVEQLRLNAPDLRVPMMIVRTAIERVGKAVESADADIVVHWSRMMRSEFEAATVSAVVDATCEAVVALANDSEVDAGTLLLFVEVMKSRAGEVLSPTTADRGRIALDSALRLLQTRDEGTCVHSRATGVWCRRLAQAMDLDAHMTERIVRAGMLHDVGKIVTPSAILTKASGLDEAEWEVMREHPDRGADLLMQIPSLAEYAPIVRMHHERLDGKGYPYGVSGSAISFEARVVSVADAFHAMVSDRPYRRPMSFGEAMSILRNGRGTQWDSTVVDAMVTAAGRARSTARDADLAKLDPAAGSAAAVPANHKESMAG